ncbi:MAG: 50S ribosomal protein L3 [Candidatus Muproteobacteria bacterium RBG_16_64_11]|uniref:Large ribosomal subunit protein uL3 n=1 Tax=Candidatus Muproteobacteria bacterium RBG_16_64_11 TaxID=1817758 RepID=A0A1F6TEQ3_9PROT|nr:MAG: 50S ribosomal protein L3 [Candidatus Muproteobacteria bacterium RBG_16_64_11]
MALGLVGKKVGMSRVYSADGSAVPVTVFEVGPNRIAQVKTADNDGYRAVQVTIGTRRPSRVTKPLAGHFAKANVAAGRGLWEFRLDAGEGDSLQPGGEVKVDIFSVGQKVDVQGTSIGKGFAGVIKRHHFAGGRASHGNSLSHRAPGSIGQRQTPGRVFPGKKMAGHLGHATRTQQNLEVVRVDVERNLLLIKGAVPGPKGADMLIRPAVKSRNKKA